MAAVNPPLGRSSSASSLGSHASEHEEDPNIKTEDTYMNGKKVTVITKTEEQTSSVVKAAKGFAYGLAGVAGSALGVAALPFAAGYDGVQAARGKGDPGMRNKIISGIGDGWTNSYVKAVTKVENETVKRAEDDNIRGKAIDVSGRGFNCKDEASIRDFANRNTKLIKEWNGKEVIILPDDSGFVYIKRGPDGEISKARCFRIFDRGSSLTYGTKGDIPRSEVEKEVLNVLEVVDDIEKFEDENGITYCVYTIDKDNKWLRAHNAVSDKDIGMFDGKDIKVAKESVWADMEKRDGAKEPKEEFKPRDRDKERRAHRHRRDSDVDPVPGTGPFGPVGRGSASSASGPRPGPGDALGGPLRKRGESI